MHHPQLEGLLPGVVRRRAELDFAVAQIDLRGALFVPDARLLLTFLGA